MGEQMVCIIYVRCVGSAWLKHIHVAEIPYDRRVTLQQKKHVSLTYTRTPWLVNDPL